MTTEQNRKLLKRIASLEADIDQLKKCRMQLAVDGYASATLSSGGGSKSYTKMDIAKITELIAELQGELKSCRSLLNGGHSTETKQVYQVWF